MRIRSRFLTRLAAGAAIVLLRLLFRTCRMEIHGDDPTVNPYQDTGPARYLYCVWHDQIVMSLFCGRPRNAAALVSRHRDGSYLAETMRRLDIAPVRGSTSRGGAQALRELIDMARDRHIVITPDGPRGPRRELKGGIVFLASQTGRPIVPIACSCRHGWRVRGSWTDMLFPRPFTTIYARGGLPLTVPPNLSREELARHTARLQAEMDRLEAEAERLARGEQQPTAERRAA